jgi:hypothetical protein
MRPINAIFKPQPKRMTVSGLTVGMEAKILNFSYKKVLLSGEFCAKLTIRIS